MNEDQNTQPTPNAPYQGPSPTPPVAPTPQPVEQPQENVFAPTPQSAQQPLTTAGVENNPAQQIAPAEAVAAPQVAEMPPQPAVQPNFQSSLQPGVVSPQMSNTPATFEPVQKKSRKGLFLAGGIVAFFVFVGVAVAAFLVLSQDDPFADLQSRNYDSLSMVVPEAWQTEDFQGDGVGYLPEKGSSLHGVDQDDEDKYDAFVFALSREIGSDASSLSDTEKTQALTFVETTYIQGGLFEEIITELGNSLCDDEVVISETKKSDPIEGSSTAFSSTVNCTVKDSNNDNTEKVTLNVVLAFTDDLTAVYVVGLGYEESTYDKYSEPLDKMLESISLAN